MVGWYSRTRNTVLNIYVVDTTCLILRIETHEIQEVTHRISMNFILRGELKFRNSTLFDVISVWRVSIGLEIEKWRLINKLRITKRMYNYHPAAGGNHKVRLFLTLIMKFTYKTSKIGYHKGVLIPIFRRHFLWCTLWCRFSWNQYDALIVMPIKTLFLWHLLGRPSRDSNYDSCFCDTLYDAPFRDVMIW